MLLSQVKPLRLFAVLTLVGIVPGWCQTATLMGTVTDAVQSKPIAGADVVVIGQGKGTISGKHGEYKVEGLKRGERIAVNYRKLGYSPDPRRYDVSLSQADNSQDAKLYQQTADSSYWLMWSTDKKLFIDKQTVTLDQRAKMYEVQWVDLDGLGLPVEARAQAARQLVYLVPQATHSVRLASFANADITKIRTYRIATRFAIEGKGTLPKDVLIPSDVAAEVTASEIMKQPPANEDEFLQQYRSVWGDQSTAQVRQILAGEGASPKK